jgi:ABC-type nitrate/sulfonate/bicarbonate transport system substrate-binding protein
MIGLTEGREGEETLFLLRDYLPILGHTTVVNNDFLAQNPDAVRAFLRAWATCMKYTIDHQAETVDLILEKYPENDRVATEWSVAR